jgi:uncharacterized protein YbjT (DUF2867 family)
MILNIRWTHRLSARTMGAMATILVLGATGKTGRRLAPLLSAFGHQVRRASRGATADVRFDWADPASFAPAIEGVGGIYLVGPDFVEDPSEQVAQLLDLASSAGVAQVVALSSLGLTFPGEPTDSGRRRTEDAITESGLRWTLLRPGGFMQNFSEGFLLPGVLKGTVRTATGTGSTALVDAADIAAVAARALADDHHAERALALTGPEALTFDQATAAISRASGRPVAHQPIDDEEFTAMLAGVGAPDEYVAMLLRDQVAIREGHAAEVSNAVDEVTGRPPVSFSAYAGATVETWTIGRGGAAVARRWS